MRVLVFLLLIFLNLKADIILEGYLHPGNNQISGYKPVDPLTTDEDATYSYYTDNPTKFYLSEDTNITRVELLNAVGIESNSNISVWIDGEVVATGEDGSNVIDIDGGILLEKGYHTIAVTGSCYDRRGNEVSCDSSRVRDVDDFYFENLKLYSNETTIALNFITRHHIGDDNDSDNNYNIDDDSLQWYPDDVESESIEYQINNTDNLYGFIVYITRMRDINENGINKLEVYDKDNNLIKSFDINHSDTGVFDYEVRYDGNISGVSKIIVKSGTLSGGGLDDISFDDLIFIPFYEENYSDLNPPSIEYKMDECSWDNDSATYEINNTGTLGSDYNASGGEANTTCALLCLGGDIISDDNADKYIIPKNNIPLKSNYTLSVWVKFPLNESGHKDFTSGGFWNSKTYNFYNIADRVGSDYDYIWFTHNVTDDTWSLNVSDDNGADAIDFNPQNLSGWHMLTFVVTGDGTDFYFDGEYNNSFTTHPDTGELGLIFNSDYGSNTDNEANGQSIGADVDEFKIFNQVLSDVQIKTIYDNEKNLKNYDGSERYCIICKALADWRMDECEWSGTDGEVGDYSGNDLNGTAFNGAETESNTTAGGGICRVGLFDGVDDYIDIAANSKLSLDGNLTYMAWIKRTDIDYVGNSDKLENIFTNQSWTNALRLTEKGYYNNGLKEHRILFQLSIDGDVKYLYSNTEINDTNWHYIAAVYDGEYMRIYIDGREDANLSVSGMVDTGNADNIIGAEYGNYYYKGYIDELKVFNTSVCKKQIENIYQYELSKKNYDGSIRVCKICPVNENYIFDARDVWRDYNDTNISTKIVNKEFNLTIASYDENKSNLQDFNGTVCVQIVDENDVNLTPWVKMEEFLNNVSEANWSGIYVNEARKTAKVKIEWKQNVDEGCPLSSEYNETNSSDEFAIRPYEFQIEDVDTYVAGRDFNLTVKAVDENGDLVKDYNESVYVRGVSVDLEYNETKSGCITGDLVKNSGDFTDGEANLSLNYSEVGEVNLTFKEVNGSEFALIDADDTPDGERFIKSASKTVKFIPAYFKADAVLSDYDRDYNFTYYDENDTVYSLIEMNISSMNAKDEITKNYNKNCYAKSIDVNITFDKVVNNDIWGIDKYRYSIVDSNANIFGIYEKDVNSTVSFTYTEGNFTTDNNGTAGVKVLLNFKRLVNAYANPVKITVNNIEINDTDLNNTSFNATGEAKFLYGVFLPKDVITQTDDINKTFNFAVYDENRSDVLKPDSKELIIELYHNLWHQEVDGNVSDSEIVVSSDYNASNRIDDVSVSVLEIKDGNITFNIKRNSGINFVVVHLLSPNLRWLWYSKFNEEYNISDSSTCLNHFCFSVTWQKENNLGEVGSGEFNGTEANVSETNSTKTGIKIFR